ncbi:hypothetical protein C8Q70DRAFT_1054836 [Cubamyces menziesii]|nr:hypothetical protein C8Q70DRAFT_1054836 [Cubamyces menziesii]
MDHKPLCDSFVFNLGDLFHRSPQPNAPIIPPTYQRMMRTLPFFEYERGNLTEARCHALLGSQFSVPDSQVAETLEVARTAVTIDERMLALVQHLKATPGVHVYAVANLSVHDWTALKTSVDETFWGPESFDTVLISATVGERMPDLAFYHHFFQHTGVDPDRTAFVDSRQENVTSATSLRMKGLVYDSTTFEDVSRNIRSLARDSIQDGEEYLLAHAGKMWSTTDTGVELHENFAQFLIYEVTQTVHLANLPMPTRLTGFFRGAGVLTTKEFPADIDTTSIAYTTISDRYPEEFRNRTMDEIAALRNEDDPVVCVNALTFFHAHGRGDDIHETLCWVLDVLQNRAYAPAGTLYYHGPDSFLYFFSRLLSVSPSLRESLARIFRERISEQYGAPGDALALSMRILAATSVGLSDSRDYARLLTMQEEDGSWPTGWIYKYGASGILVGNKGLTTAMAIAAIRKSREVQGKCNLANVVHMCSSPHVDTNRELNGYGTAT